MEQAGFIACIDFGTSNIIGLLGRKNEQGIVSIIASESIPSDSCVKHGIIYNIDEAAGKIKKLVSLLENSVGRKIGKVYLSIAGMSLRAVEHMQSRKFDVEADITFSILDRMEQEARMNKPPFLTNYSVVAPEVFLDSKLVEDPLNKRASTLEVRYRLIAGRPNIQSNLQRVVNAKNQLEIAGYIVGPISTAAILLSEEEKQKGCALVDFGGGTTTVSVYKNGLLRYMIVIPFGGRTISKDIQSLGFTFDVAELYKIKYGRIGKDKDKDKAKTTKHLSDSSVDIKELSKVIQLRQDEIVLNVIHQIKESGYGEELEAGIIITGGASQMKGLSEYLSEKSQLAVKHGGIERLYVNNATDLLQNPSYSQCLGLMLFAKDNCEKTEERADSRSTEPNSVNEVTQKTAPEKAPIAAKDESKLEATDDKGADKPKKKNRFDYLRGLGGALFSGEE